jgi:hypothetical protein
MREYHLRRELAGVVADWALYRASDAAGKRAGLPERVMLPAENKTPVD